MQFFIYYMLFYFFFFRYFIPNPIVAVLVFYMLYLVIDRQFISLDAFKPFKNRGKINRLKQDLQVNPANVNAYHQLGLIYLEKKKHETSIEYLSKTLDKMGEYSDVYFLLGKAQYLKGDKEEGIENLKKAVEMDYKIGYGEPYIYLLVEEMQEERENEKIQELVSSINRFGTPEIFYNAGKNLKSIDKEMSKGMFKAAIEGYQGTPKYFRRAHRRWAILAKIQSLL